MRSDSCHAGAIVAIGVVAGTVSRLEPCGPAAGARGGIPIALMPDTEGIGLGSDVTFTSEDGGGDRRGAAT